MFHEKNTCKIVKEDYLPHLERNAPALAALGVPNPHQLLSVILNDRHHVKLPDGHLLSPPELNIPGRKITVLGDTCDPSAIAAIAMNSSLLVHEATYADTVPLKGSGDRLREEEKIRRKAMEFGHSTARMAGEFARKIRARRLFMNHFSARSECHKKSTRHKTNELTRLSRPAIMHDVEDQAYNAWQGHDSRGDSDVEQPVTHDRAIAARDFMTVHLKSHEILEGEDDRLEEPTWSD